MSVKLNVRNVDDVVVVDASGRITLGEPANRFHEVMQNLVKTGPKKVLLNLAEVNYIDSSGTGELVTAYNLITNQGGALKLCSAGARVLTLLKITGLTTLFQIFDNEAAALQSFS